jgi:hypothetical protein
MTNAVYHSFIFLPTIVVQTSVVRTCLQNGQSGGIVLIFRERFVLSRCGEVLVGGRVHVPNEDFAIHCSAAQADSEGFPREENIDADSRLGVLSGLVILSDHFSET